MSRVGAAGEQGRPIMVATPVTWGLFASWLIHDAEEWITVAPWSRRAAAEQRMATRVLPWLRQEMPERQMHTAISVMGVMVAATSLRGSQTGGRSALFQSVLAGYALHGFSHLALSAIYRGYTPGVVTAPIVVLPFAGWAWRELGRAGVRRSAPAMAISGIAAVAASLAIAHTVAARVQIRQGPSTTESDSSKHD